MKPWGALSLVAFLAVTAASPALAGPGLHLGLSLDPDNFLAGFHWSHPLEPQLKLVPSAEVGFGDATMIAGNVDLHYQFQTSSKLAPYAGGGATLNWFDHEGGSSTDVGGSLLGGIQLSKELYLETKIGLGDVPDWKIYVGWQRP